MKKMFKLKKLIIVTICILSIMLLSNRIFALEDSELITLDDYENSLLDDYENAADLEEKEEENNIENSTDKNKANNTQNNAAKRYNTTTIPQAGVEDYNIGIILIVAVGSAIYAYTKIKDYNSL